MTKGATSGFWSDDRPLWIRILRSNIFVAIGLAGLVYLSTVFDPIHHVLRTWAHPMKVMGEQLLGMSDASSIGAWAWFLLMLQLYAYGTFLLLKAVSAAIFPPRRRIAETGPPSGPPRHSSVPPIDIRPSAAGAGQPEPGPVVRSPTIEERIKALPYPIRLALAGLSNIALGVAGTQVTEWLKAVR